MEAITDYPERGEGMPKVLKNVGIKLKPTLFFFAGHALIGFLIKNSATLGIFHSLSIFLIGIYAAMKNRQVFVDCIIAYFMGAEVLWRMTRATVFWEFAKYAIVVVALVAVMVRRKRGRETNAIIFYFLLLLPGVFLILGEPFNQLRKNLSFNLSGPLTILACCLYFSGRRLDIKGLKKMLTWCLGPIIAIAFLTVLGIRGVEELRWGTASSAAASGGFGPNQVSGILGLGMCLSINMVFLQKKEFILRIMFILLSFWFFTQAVLTFSRGGVLQGILSLGVLFIILLKSKGGKYFVILSFFGICLVSAATYYLIPKLNEFTGGSLEKRYGEKEKIGDTEVYETTGRLDMIKLDLRIFKDNLFGIGVGRSADAHKEVRGKRVSAHTEWTRLLAEHGIFGAVSIFLLLSWIIKKYREEKKPIFKAIKGSLAMSACFYMAHAAMRTALPGFLIGFLGANFKDKESEEE